MELKELKSVWQSVMPEVKSIGMTHNDMPNLSKKVDIKSRLLRRIFMEEVVSVLGLVLLATSSLWSPTQFSSLWLVSFCMIILAAILCGIKIYFAISRVNLWKDSTAAIYSAIINIKRLYRRMELIIGCIIVSLLIWLSLTPPFIYTNDMYIVWGMIIIVSGIEYCWYRHNVKQLNTFINQIS